MPSRKQTGPDLIRKFANKTESPVEVTVRLNTESFTKFLQDVQKGIKAYGTVLHSSLETMAKLNEKFRQHLLEEMSKLPDNKVIYMNQENFRSGNRWFFTENAEPHIDDENAQHRISVFKSGYPACIPCESVWCEHLRKIFEAPEPSSRFLVSALGGSNNWLFQIPIGEDAAQWVPVKLLKDAGDAAPALNPVVIELPAAVQTKLKHRKQETIGTISLEYEGIYAIQLLLVNFFYEQIIGRQKCESSSHWKTKTDKLISDVIGAASWIKSQKCQPCFENSKSMDDLIPKKEQKWNFTAAEGGTIMRNVGSGFSGINIATDLPSVFPPLASPVVMPVERYLHRRTK